MLFCGSSALPRPPMGEIGPAGSLRETVRATFFSGACMKRDGRVIRPSGEKPTDRSSSGPGSLPPSGAHLQRTGRLLKSFPDAVPFLNENSDNFQTSALFLFSAPRLSGNGSFSCGRKVCRCSGKCPHSPTG